MSGPGRPTLYKPEHASRAPRALRPGRRPTPCRFRPESGACMFWLRNQRHRTSASAILPP